MAQDSLGDRMKSYENVNRTSLIPRSYTILRIDGNAFHTYTRGLKKPFDLELIEDMNETTKYLCSKITGVQLAYVQSDEISLLLTDFQTYTTQAWFNNTLQKVVSLSASFATAKFNQLRLIREAKACGDLVANQIAMETLAAFDSRVFQLPTNLEVENYFVWRQQDWNRNSISAMAQSLYSHKELMNKNTKVQQEMSFQKGINWNDYSLDLKNGRAVYKETYSPDGVATRTKWVAEGAPTFTKTEGRDFLRKYIPLQENY